MVVSSPTVEDGGRYGGRWRAVRDEVTEEALVVADRLSLLRLKEEEEDGFSSLFVIRTEETLIEDKSLSFCTCNGERWRRLFSFYKFLKQEPHEFLGTMKQGTPFFFKFVFLIILILVFLPFFCGIEGFVLPLDYERALKFSKRHKGNSIGHRDMSLEFDASLSIRFFRSTLMKFAPEWEE
ncbi:unnamed protein product [Arabidopsis thaliana]|uniref:Transmembrane protein n=2 Tax=Arabidopsis thaliana TaxID=3702 RepID=A0A654G6B3_ARATH|nr:unnamed protein product [Arabidopsis thaliana]